MFNLEKLVKTNLKIPEKHIENFTIDFDNELNVSIFYPCSENSKKEISLDSLNTIHGDLK